MQLGMLQAQEYGYTTEEVGQDHVRLRKSPINALGMQGM